MVAMNETKNQRFRRLAVIRGNRLLKELHLLGNLANRSNYDYTEEEVREIFSAIDDELRTVKLLFANGGRKRREIQL